MSENDAHTPSTAPGDDQSTRRVEPPGVEAELSDFTRPQVVSPPPVGSAASLPRSRPPMRSERPQAAPSQQRVPRSKPAEGARRAPLPPEGYAPAAGYVPAKRPSRRQSLPHSADGLYFPWWSLVLLVGVVGLTALGIVILVGQMAAPTVPDNQSARIQVITAPPTLSQDFAGTGSNLAAPLTLWPTAIPGIQPSPTILLPTPAPSPSMPAGTVMIGAVVRVVGVEGSGLNIRSAAGYTGSPRFLAAENEQFVVVDGPQIVDELEWWRLEDPDDSSRYGWAARNYLAVVPQ